MQPNKNPAHLIRQHAAATSSTKATCIKSCGYHCTAPFHFSGSSPAQAQQ